MWPLGLFIDFSESGIHSPVPGRCGFASEVATLLFIWTSTCRPVDANPWPAQDRGKIRLNRPLTSDIVEAGRSHFFIPQP